MECCVACVGDDTPLGCLGVGSLDPVVVLEIRVPLSARFFRFTVHKSVISISSSADGGCNGFSLLACGEPDSSLGASSVIAGALSEVVMRSDARVLLDSTATASMPSSSSF